LNKKEQTIKLGIEISKKDNKNIKKIEVYGMQILVFTSSKCPHCPNAEHVVREVAPNYANYNVSHKKIRAGTEEGKELFGRYNIMGTPTILFLDEEGNELKKIVGTPNENNLRGKIEKLLGLKKSFFDKLFLNKKEK
jgi:thioredoxin-related protein